MYVRPPLVQQEAGGIGPRHGGRVALADAVSGDVEWECGGGLVSIGGIVRGQVLAVGKLTGAFGGRVARVAKHRGYSSKKSAWLGVGLCVVSGGWMGVEVVGVASGREGCAGGAQSR